MEIMIPTFLITILKEIQEEYNTENKIFLQLILY